MATIYINLKKGAVKSYQDLKTQIIPKLLKLPQSTEKERKLLPLFHKDSVTLIPHSDKERTRKLNYNSY